MTVLGKANYEAWRKADGWHGSSSEDLEYNDLRSADRAAFDAGADAVEAWLAAAPVDEDAPGNEPAKVIVVTEAPVGERGALERRYAADVDDKDAAYGFLKLRRDGREVARYQPMAWLSVREEGAELPFYGPGKKLAIALDALRTIRELYGNDPRDTPDVAADIDARAAQALDDIADMDL